MSRRCSSVSPVSHLAIGIVLLAGIWTAGARAGAAEAGPVAAAPAAVAPAATAPTVVETAAAAKPEPKLICRMEKPMGSNIGKRVCRTQEVIKEEEAQAHDVMNHVDQARNASSPAG